MAGEEENIVSSGTVVVGGVVDCIEDHWQCLVPGAGVVEADMFKQQQRMYWILYKVRLLQVRYCRLLVLLANLGEILSRGQLIRRLVCLWHIFGL